MIDKLYFLKCMGVHPKCFYCEETSPLFFLATTPDVPIFEKCVCEKHKDNLTIDYINYLLVNIAKD
ncbi:MAG: hypothetical protein AABY22_20655 [Nanoarchaeota archaeon]